MFNTSPCKICIIFIGEGDINVQVPPVTWYLIMKASAGKILWAWCNQHGADLLIFSFGLDIKDALY